MDPQTAPKNVTPAKAKPPEPPKPSLPSLPEIDWSKPVPVAVVHFDLAVNVPGRDSNKFVRSTPPAERTARPNGPTLDIELLAPVRQFRLTFTDASRGMRKVGFVPESRSLGWEPVA